MPKVRALYPKAISIGVFLKMDAVALKTASSASEHPDPDLMT